ncbi:DUF2892 domain-containing protein [Candidatus Woesearchaeota archaeon]|nr:DUF2892 domain-containing protein [Candidatus Woesearchaeota archaeon]
MVKQNLGTLDRIFRFVLAIWWLSPWMPQTQYVWLQWVLWIVAWIALAESFLGWCWLHRAFHISNKN